jgi:hypothetical protein
MVHGFWFLVSGFWFLVSGFWFLVSGFWFLVINGLHDCGCGARFIFGCVGLVPLDLPPCGLGEWARP